MVTTMHTCPHCGAVHPADAEYGAGCPFLPETWPEKLQREQEPEYWPSRRQLEEDLGHCEGIGRSTWDDLTPPCPFRAKHVVDGKKLCQKHFQMVRSE